MQIFATSSPPCCHFHGFPVPAVAFLQVVGTIEKLWKLELFSLTKGQFVKSSFVTAHRLCLMRFGSYVFYSSVHNSVHSAATLKKKQMRSGPTDL